VDVLAYDLHPPKPLPLLSKKGAPASAAEGEPDGGAEDDDDEFREEENIFVSTQAAICQCCLWCWGRRL